jgi:hypothetical protein
MNLEIFSFLLSTATISSLYFIMFSTSGGSFHFFPQDGMMALLNGLSEESRIWDGLPKKPNQKATAFEFLKTLQQQ